MTWKKKIKKLLPDKLVYSYDVIRTVPEYLKALKDKSQIPDIKFYSDEETVSLIVKERKSLSRFGDGECLIHPNVIFMRKCIGELFVPIFFPD